MTEIALAEELLKATGVKPKKKESRQGFLKRMMDAVQKLKEDQWDELSKDAQNWYNKACDDEKEKRDITDFAPPEEAEGEAAPAKKSKKTAKEDDESEDGEEGEEGEEGETKADDESEQEDQESEVKKTASKKKQPAKPAQKANGGSKDKGKGKAKAAKEKAAPGYKGHRAGSRKEQAHKLYDELGAEKARPKVEKLGIAGSTISTWFAVFGKGNKKK